MADHNTYTTPYTYTTHIHYLLYTIHSPIDKVLLFTIVENQVMAVVVAPCCVFEGVVSAGLGVLRTSRAFRRSLLTFALASLVMLGAWGSSFVSIVESSCVVDVDGDVLVVSVVVVVVIIAVFIVGIVVAIWIFGVFFYFFFLGASWWGCNI